jgi:hypothetical protein
VRRASARVASSNPRTLTHLSSGGSSKGWATADHVGTAALGCPVERSSTGFCDGRHSGALLRRTAEAAVPTWFSSSVFAAHRPPRFSSDPRPHHRLVR